MFTNNNLAIKHVNVWFENEIQKYINNKAENDEDFKNEYLVAITEDGKNIIDCVNYILMQTAKAHFNPDTDQTPCASEAEQLCWAEEYFSDRSIKNEDIETPFKKKAQPAPQPKAETKVKASKGKVEVKTTITETEPMHIVSSEEVEDFI